jgi:hypothetical protein
LAAEELVETDGREGRHPVEAVSHACLLHGRLTAAWGKSIYCLAGGRM